MGRHNVQLQEAQESFDELIAAVKSVQDWRERVQLSHGMTPPTSYYRVLLCVFIHETKQAQPRSPYAVGRLARNVGITKSGLDGIVRRMAYDGLLTITNDPDNRDIKLIALTSEGTEMAQA